MTRPKRLSLGLLEFLNGKPRKSHMIQSRLINVGDVFLRLSEILSKDSIKILYD